MADFKLRLSDDLAARSDVWVCYHGGRSRALRHLIACACAAKADGPAPPPGWPPDRRN
ncbi:MAG TPA: hypothetical protein VHW60_16045 [Caulobacteraceae bacterium]|nr:hypothetical protein [Caulobacteraceae bacterium]